MGRRTSSRGKGGKKQQELPLLDVVLVQLVLSLGWPHALRLAETAAAASAAAVVVLSGMLTRCGLNPVPRDLPSGLLQLRFLVSGLAGVIDLDTVHGAREYAGVRAVGETLRRPLRPLPPARACQIPPSWEDLPVLCHWLGDAAASMQWYQLVWYERLDASCSALCVRTGVRLLFEGWRVDVSKQNTHFDIDLTMLEQQPHPDEEDSAKETE